MVVESMNDFQRRVYAISGEISQRIQERAREIKERDVPEPMQLKVAPKKPPRTKVKLDTGLDLPTELSGIRSKIQERDYSETIMSSIEDLRGPNVTITGMRKGHREDGRDVILKGEKKEGRVSTQIDDLRILFGDSEAVKNEVLSGRILRELNLPYYAEQGVLYPSPAGRKKVA